MLAPVKPLSLQLRYGTAGSLPLRHSAEGSLNQLTSRCRCLLGENRLQQQPQQQLPASVSPPAEDSEEPAGSEGRILQFRMRMEAGACWNKKSLHSGRCGACSASTSICAHFLDPQHLLTRVPQVCHPAPRNVNFSCLNRDFGFTFLRPRPKESSFHSLPLPTKCF